MTDFKMPDAQVKAEFVRTNFNMIASKYDLFNDLNSFFMHRHWKNSITQLIQKTFPSKSIQVPQDQQENRLPHDEEVVHLPKSAATGCQVTQGRSQGAGRRSQSFVLDQSVQHNDA